MKKISEFLSEFGDHAILDSNACKQAFEAETGQAPDWPDYSYSEMLSRIAIRGKGGELTGPHDGRFIGSLDLAEWACRTFIDGFYDHGKYGMGFAFRQCIFDLQKAGH